MRFLILLLLIPQLAFATDEQCDPSSENYNPEACAEQYTDYEDNSQITLNSGQTEYIEDALDEKLKHYDLKRKQKNESDDDIISFNLEDNNTSNFNRAMQGEVERSQKFRQITEMYDYTDPKEKQFGFKLRIPIKSK